MPISIPVNAYIVTLNGVDPKWSESEIRSAFKSVNTIFASSGIDFSIRDIKAISDTSIGESASEALEDSTFFYLASRYPGKDIPAAYFVKLFAGTEGGTSTTANHKNWVLAVGYTSNQASAARILAHELGHLLDLDHIDQNFEIGPTSPLRDKMRKNLMFSRISLDTKLDAEQVKKAKSSALARRFGP